MKKLLVFFIVLTFTQATENEIEKGEKLYTTKGCYGCHGSNAQGIGNYPKLAGKSIYYLTKRLKGYKNKTIHSNRASIMQAFAASLNEIQIKALAKYLNGLGQKKIHKNDQYFEEYEVGDSSGS